MTTKITPGDLLVWADGSYCDRHSKSRFDNTCLSLSNPQAQALNQGD